MMNSTNIQYNLNDKRHRKRYELRKETPMAPIHLKQLYLIAIKKTHIYPLILFKLEKSSKLDTYWGFLTQKFLLGVSIEFCG